MKKGDQNENSSARKKGENQKPAESAPRRGQYGGKSRRRRNKNKAPPQTRKEAIASNDKITPVGQLVTAPGVLSTIDVTVTLVLDSIRALPVGIISLGAVRGQSKFFYSAYKVFLQDILSLILSGTGTATARLQYMQEIYGVMVPKVVPFRRDCAISYKTEALSDLAPDVIPVGNGYNYYMYQDDGGSTVGFLTQSPPLPTTDSQDRTNYLATLNVIATKVKHKRIDRNVNLALTYLKDASFFTRISKYYGSTLGVGGPYCSTELEVPFKSALLGTVIEFDSNTPRAARVFDKSSGGTTSNFALGCLDGFRTTYYNGAVPPIYKFLDIMEVSFLLCRTVTQALSSFYSNSQITPDNSYLDMGLGIPQSTFLLMLRQQILWMFADSQCIGQFMAPDTQATSFAPFVCGSNCFPQEPSSKMTISKVLNENLKMLKLVIRPYVTNKLNNNNNHITSIPVWGAYKRYQMPVFEYVNSQGVLTNLFAPEPSLAPNIWDGTMQDGTVANLNGSVVLADAVGLWNEFMLGLTTVISSLDAIGGDSLGSPLLQFTRYVKFVEQDQDKCKEVILAETQRVPRMYDSYITSRKKILTRTNSKDKEVSVLERVLSIPDSTVFQEYTLHISGMIPITPTHKEFFPDLILPSVDIDDNNDIPNQSQYQTSVLEAYSLKKTNDATFFANRAQELETSIKNHVVGIAGKETPLSLFITSLANNNQGAFFGDLFAFAGGIAGSLGI